MPFTAHDLRYKAEETYPALYAHLTRHAQRFLQSLKYDAVELDLVVGHVVEHLVLLGLLGGGDRLASAVADAHVVLGQARIQCLGAGRSRAQPGQGEHARDDDQQPFHRLHRLILPHFPADRSPARPPGPDAIYPRRQPCLDGLRWAGGGASARPRSPSW